MTAQIQDTVHYDGTAFALTAVDGVGLFDPTAHGLTPAVLSTACWRGFICTYRVDKGTLLLTDLEIGLRENQHPQQTPDLFGQPAVRARAKPFHEGALQYRPAAPIIFTGRLLLGAKGATDIYLNMGFRPAWFYQDVRELVFADGLLLSTTNRSAAAAETRAVLGPDGAKPQNGESISDWVDRTFSLTFEYSLPQR